MGKLQTIDERIKNRNGKCRPGQHWVPGHNQRNPSGFGTHWVRGHCADDPNRMRTTRVEKTTSYGWDRGPFIKKETRTIKERKDRRI